MADCQFQILTPRNRGFLFLHPGYSNKQVVSLLAFSLLIILSGCQIVGNTALKNPGELTETVQVLTPIPSGTSMIISIPSPTPAPPQLEVGPDNFPTDINPLTGLKVADPSRLERRPLAIKVSNDPRPIRPQWGLSRADIVYEYYTEWSKTRFVAIFYGEDAQQVGPIRSARFFDEHVIQMYKAVLAFVGADERVLKRFYHSPFKDLLISEWPAGCPPICRVDEKMWSYAVTNTRILSKFISKEGIANGRQELDGMGFAQSPPVGGQPVDYLSIRFSPYFYTRWVYDASINKYMRYQDKEDDLGQGESYELLSDRLTGQPITADNVVVIQVRYDEIAHKADTEVYQMDLWKAGPAYLFRDGKVYLLHWQRNATHSVLTLFDQDNNLFPFKPGNTWFEVLGLSSNITQPKEANYRFELGIP